MEEINLKELFDYFKARLVTIIIILLVIIIMGSVFSLFVKKPLYESTSTIVLVSEDGTTSSASYTQSDVQLNKSLVGTYSEIVTSKRIIGQVIDNLGLENDYTVNQLRKNITVSAVNNTEIIKIEVVNEDKGYAADIANEIVKVFSEEIKSIYKLQNVSQVDIAEAAEAPYNINFIKDLVIYILVGIVLGFGTIFVIFYFDTTIKSVDEIENKLGLPVYGVVPKVKRREK